MIPRERTKADRELTVPLSPLAIEIVQSLPRFGSAFVFPATRARKLAPGMSPAQARASKPMSGFSTAKPEVDRLVREAGHVMPAWRWHDLRTNLPVKLVTLGRQPRRCRERLGHVPQGVVAVYDRWTYRAEKTEALDRWAALLADIIDPARKIVQAARLRLHSASAGCGKHSAQWAIFVIDKRSWGGRARTAFPQFGPIGLLITLVLSKP